MKTQISRKSFNAAKRYSGVYQQMGRMLTDADWNELSDLAKNRLADALTDVISSGTPRDRGIVDITENLDGTKSYSLRWGYAYVDGIIAQVRPDPNATLTDPSGLALEYQHQADFPNPQPCPVGDHKLYLDVWERTVVVLEDDDLRDAGLQGADTCTRTQTMAQVKWCDTTTDPQIVSENPPIGEARLTLELREASTDVDQCDPCADEIALQDKVGNYLFRVEIHHVEYDGAGLPDRLILKWSSENGAEQYIIDEEPAGFASDDWVYEFFDGYFDEDAATLESFDSEKHLGKHLATGFTPTRGELTEGYPATVPAGYTAVRRWDGYCELAKSGALWTLVDGVDRGVDLSTSSGSDAPGHVAEGSTVTINLDAITLTINVDDHQMLAADFWYAVVRQAVNVAGDVLLTDEEPSGILHHYMTLGSVIGDVFIAYQGDQCKRFKFPPLTDIRAKDVCYDNTACEMPDVGTMQDAIDYLCQERDLRWHNKHLHGWGIVCGLIAECGPDTFPNGDDDDNGDEEELERREVRVTEGYALTCKGEDIVLDDDLVFDLMTRIEEMEAADIPVLNEAGDGTVCLRLDQAADGTPEVNAEAYDSAIHGNKSLLDGTLLMDFYQDCLIDLVESIVADFQFLNPNEIDEVEGGSSGLVSTERRKFTSMLNLVIQFFNVDNGAYVFLSHKDHLILRDIYLGLRELLQSKTFCGMFAGDEFPEYPFPDTNMSTYFGKNFHTRVKLHPGGERVYTYGGSGNDTGNTINVYDVNTEELIQVLEMPSAEGAEVSAITFSDDGNLLYAAAVVRGEDSVFGAARVNDDHTWEAMTILCGIEITEMELAADDPGLIYAIGRSNGLYYLRPEVLDDQSKPQPIAVYAFNAAGHMVIDPQARRAYCTELFNTEVEPTEYDTIAVCKLAVDAGDSNSLAPSVRVSLVEGTSGPVRVGSDGLAIRLADADGEGRRLFVVVNAPTGADQKQLWTYARPLTSVSQPQAILNIQNTQVSLAYHAINDRLILALEGGYRLQLVNQNGEATNIFRVPVQIQPVDIIVEPNKGNIYALNYVSNTINLVPADEKEVGTDFLDELVDYRTEILLAFYSLLGGLLQYLKDCFCHHLLIKCPECNVEEDILYLATVDIRENQIYKICNFDKRKYVKSFPTMGYWFSLIPIWPLLKRAVSQFCCMILPDFFEKYQNAIVRTPQFSSEEQLPAENFIKADTARQSMQAYQRTDIKAFTRNQAKSVDFLGRAAGDSAMNFARSTQPDKGVPKQALMDSSVNDATLELNKNNIEVMAVKEYDGKDAGGYVANYVRTPQRIPPGSKVTLYQKNGKVAFYAIEKEASATVEIPESVKLQIAQLETRKENLANFSAVNAELARVETRYANVSALDEVKAELSDLQVKKLSVEEELAALRTQVEEVKTQRENEVNRINELDVQRTTISSDLKELKKGLEEMDVMRKGILLEVAKGRPVKEVSGVTPEVDVKLREAGIRTVNELSASSASQLVRETGVSKAIATRIVNAAKARLKLTEGS